MILWMILTLMVALAAVGLTLPLIARFDPARRNDAVVEILKTQLADIDAEAAADSVSEADAQGLRLEVQRRLLAEGRAPATGTRPLSNRSLLILVFSLAAVVAIAATGLYAKLGRPDLASPAPAAPAAQATTDPAHPGGGDVAGMIAQLEAKLKQAPNDPQGWSMLGWSYFQTGRFAEAASAYGQAATLEPANSEHLSAQGESLVRAAEGQVTPAAQAAFRKAVAIDAGDPRARYFLAVAKDQSGDRKGAMDDWIALLRSAPAAAPWAAEVRGFVEKTARDRGEDISGRLPPAPPGQAAGGEAAAAPAMGAPGPDASQVAAAGQMSDAQRQTMIAGMVEGLAAKLKANPNDPEGWVRLIRARMVLGQTDQAAAAYRDARKSLGPADQAQLQQAAKSLGVPGA